MGAKSSYKLFSAVCSEWQIERRFWSIARLKTSLERSGHPPQENDVPSTIHGKKCTAPVKYTFTLFSSVTPQDGLLLLVSPNLDRLPVSKGLVCSPSLHLLLVFFLVVQRLAFQLPDILFFTDSVRGFLPIRSIPVDFETFFARQVLEYRQTDPRKSTKKLWDFRKSLHVQRRVVVKWDY